MYAFLLTALILITSADGKNYFNRLYYLFEHDLGTVYFQENGRSL